MKRLPKATKPTADPRPRSLLAPGELLQVCAGWHIVAYEHGLRTAPERVVQRMVAINTRHAAPPPLPLMASPLPADI